MEREHKRIDPDTIERTRFENIVDVGLTASAMTRLFAKGTKESKLGPRIIQAVKQILKAKSELEFNTIHSRFCQWGTSEIALARKNKPASYGQIAKTFNVVLKVAVYYCHLPEYEKSKELSKWLHAAVDSRMMAKLLRKQYPLDMKPWPRTIEEVDRQKYEEIQEIVKKFIREVNEDSIIPVQFDDYYWRELKYGTH